MAVDMSRQGSVQPARLQVFLSHSSRDAELVEWLASRVRDMGIEPYLAKHDHQGGTQLSDKVLGAIRESAAMLVPLTESAYEAAYVQQEIGAAVASQTLVIVLVDPATPVPDLGMLQGVEWVSFDFANPTAECMADLYATLYRVGQATEIMTPTEGRRAGLTVDFNFEAHLHLEPAELLVAGGIALAVVALLVYTSKSGGLQL
jgi:hypothetical protein